MITQISLRVRAVWSKTSLYTWRNFTPGGYLKCTLWRFWPDCANAQADLNLRWAHMSKQSFLSHSLVLTILYFCTEVLRFQQSQDVDKVHSKSLKQNHQISNIAIYGENGSVPFGDVNTRDRFSAMWYKGDNLCHFLFAVLSTKSQGAFFSIRVDPFSEERLDSFERITALKVYWLIEMRFYDTVNSLGSCRARSVYLTTLFLDRLNPLSGWPVFVHILSPETDNCPSWISGRERMTLENISWFPLKAYPFAVNVLSKVIILKYRFNSFGARFQTTFVVFFVFY